MERESSRGLPNPQTAPPAGERRRVAGAAASTSTAASTRLAVARQTAHHRQTLPTYTTASVEAAIPCRLPPLSLSPTAATTWSSRLPGTSRPLVSRGHLGALWSCSVGVRNAMRWGIARQTCVGTVMRPVLAVSPHAEELVIVVVFLWGDDLNPWGTAGGTT